MNSYLIVILSIIAMKYVLGLVIDTLNVKNADPHLPKEFEGFYDAQKYNKSQLYLKDKTSFSLFEETFTTVVTVIFILVGGFNLVDNFARGFGLNPIFTSLIFLGVLMLASQILGIPFSMYHTFVIEGKYGFNKTTPKTFALDIVKGLLIGAVIAGITFGAVVWFFTKTGNFAWIFCWVGLTFFQLFLMFIAPVVIMPIFNKFIPLEDSELKTTLENYARSQDF